MSLFFLELKDSGEMSLFFLELKDSGEKLIPPNE